MNFIEQMGMTEYSSDSESIKLSLIKDENNEDYDDCNC